jgi:hypothetical protein
MQSWKEESDAAQCQRPVRHHASALIGDPINSDVSRHLMKKRSECEQFNFRKSYTLHEYREETALQVVQKPMT